MLSRSNDKALVCSVARSRRRWSICARQSWQRPRRRSSRTSRRAITACVLLATRIRAQRPRPKARSRRRTRSRRVAMTSAIHSTYVCRRCLSSTANPNEARTRTSRACVTRPLRHHLASRSFLKVNRGRSRQSTRRSSPQVPLSTTTRLATAAFNNKCQV